MAIAHVATTSLSSATRTTTTINMPAGLAAGAEVRIIVSVGVPSLTPTTITPPANVTLVTGVSYGNTDPYTVQLNVYRYRYLGSGDPASFAFTHASGTSNGGATSYSGVHTTPDDVTPITVTQNTNTTISSTGITTTTENTMLLLVRGSWDGAAISPPAGYTELIDLPVTWVGHSLKAAIGATGTITVGSGNTSTGPNSLIIMALREASLAPPATGSLKLESGSRLILEGGSGFLRIS